MRLSTLVLALLMFTGWPAAASAGDWYVHRTSHQMNTPPWYCYCYRIAKASVLPGTVTYPMDMQISWEQALSKLEAYKKLPDTCTNNCGFGSGDGVSVDVNPPPPGPPPPRPAPECDQLAEFGGCEGFCKGKTEEAGTPAETQDCINNCLEKFHCER